MSRIEKEHGCTLSRREETRTRGKSHAPLLLRFQMIEEVLGLYFKNIIPKIATTMIIKIVIVFFIIIMVLLPL